MSAQSLAKAKPTQSTASTSNSIYIKKWLVHALKIFPLLTKAHLNQSMMPCKSTSPWQPILRDLIADGIVASHFKVIVTPHGRTQHLEVFSLGPNADEFITTYLADTQVDDVVNTDD